MKEWKCENCMVQEREFDYDLHEFIVYDIDGFIIAVITPSDLKDMERIKNSLDSGSDPIKEQWEDGKGRAIDLNDKFYDDDYEVLDYNKDEGYEIEYNGMSGTYNNYHWYTMKNEEGKERDIYISSENR